MRRSPISGTGPRASPRSRRGSRASAGPAGPAACRGPSTAGRRARGRSARRCAAAARRPTSTRIELGAHAARGLLERPRPRAGSPRRPRRCPRRRISAARWVLLPPGRRAEVEHALARAAGRARGATSIAARDCAVKAPSLPQRRAVDVERLLEHERLGDARVAVRGDTRAARRELVGVADERVGAQRELGGLVVARHQRARLLRARAPPTTARAIHSGWEWATAAPRGSCVAERAEQPPGPLRGRPAAAPR